MSIFPALYVGLLDMSVIMAAMFSHYSTGIISLINYNSCLIDVLYLDSLETGNYNIHCTSIEILELWAVPYSFSIHIIRI